MKKFKVVILDDRYDNYNEEYKVLEQIDAEVIIEPSTEQRVVENAVKDVDGVIVNLAQINERVIKSMNKCKCVSRYGVGCDNVNADELNKAGIFLANVPDYCAEEVSDQAFALWMSCVRLTSLKDKLIRKGQWNLAGIQKIHRITGSTFGFVGFGMIAQSFARKLKGFNLDKILVSDPILTDEKAKALGVRKVELDVLCKQSDYISLHAPLLESTKGLIGKEQLSLMKKTAILINTSRGGLIKEDELIQALKDKTIANAGLDVFQNEPLEESSELRNLDNVILSDHAGWYSEESMSELKRKAAQNIADTLINGKPLYEV